MAASYSRSYRVFQALKYALPILAAVSLGVLFFILREVPVSPDQSSAQMVHQPSIAQKIESPIFEGSTANGALISVGAAIVEPDTINGVITARQISARLTLPQNGPRFLLTAPQAELKPDTAEARFYGNIRAQSTQGFSFATDTVQLTSDPVAVFAPHAVRARHPLGDIDAGSIHITALGGAVKIDFQGGVRLLYNPQAQ